MKVAIIIVCYNGEKYIKDCIQSLMLDPLINKIIVVDNNSSDTSLDIIRSMFPDVILVALDKNIGFGPANNLGLEIAIREKCDYFFLLNQDAYCEPNCVSSIVEIHRRNKDYGIIAPLQLNGNGDSVDTKYYDYLFYQNKEIGFDLLRNNIKDVYTVDFVNAAAWLVSRECLLKVGGFDPIFFHTGEDDDYVQRVKHWGFKIGIAPSVSVRHDRPQISWLTQKAGLGRQVTLDILRLKNIKCSYSKNLLHVIKKNSYYITYDLAKMKFESAKIKALSFVHIVKLTSAIKRSRKKGLEEFAFLKR